MRRLTAIFVALVAVTSCGKKLSVVVPPLPPLPPLPVVKLEDVPAPANATVLVKKGTNMNVIATDAYGHRDFSGFVASLNGIRNPELVIAGTTLKTPSLARGLKDAGLDPHYQPAINVLAKCWTDVRAFLPDYEEQRRASGVSDGGTFAVTEPLSLEMLRCADAMDAAIDVLNRPKDGHKLPKSTVGNFKGSSGALRWYASGNVESNDYDVFLLQKGFGQGCTYLLIWVQSGHR